MRRIGFLSMVLAASVAVACNQDRKDAAKPGAESPAVGTAGKSDVSRADKDFVHDVAMMNMAEIELGRLASEKGSTAPVKKFAQEMIDDHTKAGDSLRTLASQNNIEIPAQVDDKFNDTRDKLSKKTGLDFDRDYASEMVNGHQDFVDKLESRVDKDKLSEWKARHTDANGKKVEANSEAEVIVPEKSDDPVTMKINQWAADTYPVAFAHLEAAKALEKGAKQRTTN
jgi:putative membrane protein